MSTTENKVMEQTPNNETHTECDSQPEFNRALVESLSKQIKLADSADGLDLFCYIRCDVSDSDTIKKCRGVVFNGDKLVMNGFPYTYEYSENDYDEMCDKLNDTLGECSFYDSYEGSLIRMFYFGDKWYISTNRKLDANKSKWSSTESFGHFFKQALLSEYENNIRLRESLDSVDESLDLVERFQTLLNKDNQYMFLLLNNDQNRIVCAEPTRPTVFHVGTFINGVLDMNQDVILPYPKRHNFETLPELFNYVKDVDIGRLQGVIVFAPDNIQYKIFNEEYYDLYRVRGNEPSVKFRYLQVRMDKRYNNLLHYLYPNFSKTFDDYENTLYSIGKEIYTAYVNRFIKNQYIKVPPEEFQVVRTCHEWHLADKTTNKISLDKVLRVLNEQTPTTLNKMIRRQFISQKEQSDKPKEHVENTKPVHKPLLKRNNKNAKSEA